LTRARRLPQRTASAMTRNEFPRFEIWYAREEDPSPIGLQHRESQQLFDRRHGESDGALACVLDRRVPSLADDFGGVEDAYRDPDYWIGPHDRRDSLKTGVQWRARITP
jgi:hypothetical protein